MHNRSTKQNPVAQNERPNLPDPEAELITSTQPDHFIRIEQIESAQTQREIKIENGGDRGYLQCC